MTEELEKLKSKFDSIGDVRGVGLFQGIEFNKKGPNGSIDPHPELAKFCVDFLRYEKILVSRDGPDENVIKIKPPLVFSKSNVDMLVSSLTKALENSHVINE